MRAQYGRLEARFEVRVPVQLVSLESPGPSESTLTENVSGLGIRVVTRRPWRPGERLLITAPTDDIRTPARVVYCQALPGNRFGIGLEFQGPSIRWGELRRTKKLLPDW